MRCGLRRTASIWGFCRNQARTPDLVVANDALSQLSYTPKSDKYNCIIFLHSMSYQVLARKYRPQTFDEIVGQGHVATTLTSPYASKVAHAYLFSGPRGVGKTTTARILAKALNCVKGPTPTPCNACDSCLRIAQGQELVDVLGNRRRLQPRHRRDPRTA